MNNLEPKNISVKDLTLEKYIKYYNEVLYPLNYPYYLRSGLRANNKISIIVQIGIPRDIDNNDFDIDSATEYDFQDLIEISGDSDEDVINTFSKINWNINHKEYFKKLWTVNNDE